MVEETIPELIDSVDLGAATRTENYEIAAYLGLRRMAKAMGECGTRNSVLRFAGCGSVMPSTGSSTASRSGAVRCGGGRLRPGWCGALEVLPAGSLRASWAG